jgi:hypothetical protein
MYKLHKANSWKRQLIEIAKDFGYPKDVIAKIKECETEDEASVIMANARRAILG